MKNEKTLQRAITLGLLLSLGYQGTTLCIWPFSKPKPPKGLTQKAIELATASGKHLYKQLSEKETQINLAKLFGLLGAGAAIGNIAGKILKPKKSEKERPTIKKGEKETTQSKIPEFPHFFHHIANNQEHLITSYNGAVYIAKLQGNKVAIQSHRLVSNVKDVQIRRFDTQTSNNIALTMPNLYVMAGEVFGVNVQNEIQRIHRKLGEQQPSTLIGSHYSW